MGPAGPLFRCGQAGRARSAGRPSRWPGRTGRGHAQNACTPLDQFVLWATKSGSNQSKHESSGWSTVQ